MPRVRVGQSQSVVLQGDLAPSGGTYRNGMFAPTVSELSSAALAAADEASLLPSSLPIYNEDGFVDESKLEAWKPNFFGMNVGEDVPKYAQAVLSTSMENMGGQWVNDLGLESVSFDMESPVGEFSKGIIASVHNTREGQFHGGLIIYQPFYQYVSIPIIPGIPGRYTGLSVATYAVHHAIGHLAYARLVSDGNISKLGDFLEFSGWKKGFQDGALPSSYMNHKTESGWYRASLGRVPTEACKFSPEDDFAENFALTFTHRKYMEVVFPERYTYMVDILEGFGCIIE